MNYLLRDKEPQTLYQAFVTARNIENKLKYGLMRGHFSMNDCQYNVFERKDEHSVDTFVPNQNINTPAISLNQIGISNQIVCVEKNEFIVNQATYVPDVTAVRGISYFDRNEKCVDIVDQGLATLVSSCNTDYVHNDVAYEVAAPRSQSCASEKVESYLSDDELDFFDPICHGEITQDEECESHSSQS